MGLWVWLGGTHTADRSDVVEEFGMLLGPEETPAVQGFLGAIVCLGRLTHCPPWLWVGVGVVAVVGWGCGGVLSVA